MLNIFFVLAFIIDIVEKLKNKYMIWDSTYISFQGLLILRKYAETTNLTIIERHIIRTKVPSLLKFTKIYVKNFTFNHHPFRKSNASQTLQSRIQVRGELVGMENTSYHLLPPPHIKIADIHVCHYSCFYIKHHYKLCTFQCYHSRFTTFLHCIGYPAGRHLTASSEESEITREWVVQRRSSAFDDGVFQRK